MTPSWVRPTPSSCDNKSSGSILVRFYRIYFNDRLEMLPMDGRTVSERGNCPTPYLTYISVFCHSVLFNLMISKRKWHLYLLAIEGLFAGLMIMMILLPIARMAERIGREALCDVSCIENLFLRTQGRL